MKKSANKLNRTFKKQGQTWMSCLLHWADYTVINVCSINLNKISVKENELNSKREREYIYPLDTTLNIQEIKRKKINWVKR